MTIPATTIPCTGLSVRQASKSLGVCERTVWVLVKTGELRSARIGRRRIIPAGEPQRFLESKINV